MPRNKDTTATPRTYISWEDYALVQAYAHEHNTTVAEIMRSALGDYMRRNGVRLNLKLDRGGSRR